MPRLTSGGPPPSRRRINRAPSPVLAHTLPWLTILLGSMIPGWLLIASAPVMPPLGFLLFIAWRQLRPGLLPIWSALPLGLFDDLVSGQPLGTAMFFWTLCYLAVDVLDSRLVFRNFWHDLVIATGALGFVLVAGRLVATPFGAHVDTALLLQFVISAALLPFAYRLAMRLDRDRRPR